MSERSNPLHFFASHWLLRTRRMLTFLPVPPGSSTRWKRHVLFVRVRPGKVGGARATSRRHVRRRLGLRHLPCDRATDEADSTRPTTTYLAFPLD